jgi:hypothetical protein
VYAFLSYRTIKCKVHIFVYISEKLVLEMDVSQAGSDTAVTSWVCLTKTFRRLPITTEAEEKIRYTLTNCRVTRLAAPVLGRGEGTRAGMDRLQTNACGNPSADAAQTKATEKYSLFLPIS